MTKLLWILVGLAALVADTFGAGPTGEFQYAIDPLMLALIMGGSSALGAGGNILGGSLSQSEGIDSGDIKQLQALRPAGQSGLQNILLLNAMIQSGATPFDMSREILLNSVAQNATDASARQIGQAIDSAQAMAQQGDLAGAQAIIDSINVALAGPGMPLDKHGNLKLNKDGTVKNVKKGIDIKTGKVGPGLVSLDDSGQVRIEIAGELGQQIASLEGITGDIFGNRAQGFANLAQIAAEGSDIPGLQAGFETQLQREIEDARAGLLQQANVNRINPAFGLSQLQEFEQDIPLTALQRVQGLLGAQNQNILGIQGALGQTAVQPALSALNQNATASQIGNAQAQTAGQLAGLGLAGNENFGSGIAAGAGGIASAGQLFGLMQMMNSQSSGGPGALPSNMTQMAQLQGLEGLFGNSIQR